MKYVEHLLWKLRLSRLTLDLSDRHEDCWKHWKHTSGTKQIKLRNCQNSRFSQIFVELVLLGLYIKADLSGITNVDFTKKLQDSLYRGEVVQALA